MQSQSNLTSTNKPKNLRHVVLFKFKDASSAEDIKKVETAFGVLPSKISQIKGYEWGTNNSPENHNEGFTHSFVLTFTSEADRDAYLIHPEHKAFGKVLGPHLDKVLVIDFWAMN
ncbi:MAG: Dabb family protein [Saprospiraceae bacterium]|nr:Dabb family protein [Saprospiraceae bacterium]MBP8941858.1 Dabb family protein [Saprospiraceae bacterium]MBP9744218.1 Dabb family protein [Saprospiraceae bacterium]